MGKRARRVFFKRAARHMLFSDWIIQILAFLIVGAVYVGVFHFGNSLGGLVYYISDNTKLYGIFASVYATLSTALFIPLLSGLVNFEINAIENGKGNLSDIFDVFSSVEMLQRAYKLFLYVLLRTVILLLPGALVLVFAETGYYDGFFLYEFSLFGYDVYYFLLKAAALVLLYLGFVRLARYFVGIYVCIFRKDLGIRESFFVADVCMGTQKGEVSSLAISFLPLCTVSLFTAGFLPVLYTMPYMLISFVMYSKYIYDKEMHTKNAQIMTYAPKECE